MGMKRDRDTPDTQSKGDSFLGGLFSACSANTGGGGFCSAAACSSSRTDPHDTDILNFLQGEFDNLTQEEQDRVHRDLYGIEEVSVEVDDPIVMQEILEELEKELLSISDHKKGAYLEALVRCPKCFSCDMLLKFLRADGYNPKKAARRITQHWEMRVELWGPHRAFKERLTLEDLGEGDLLALRAGGLRLLKGRDRAGRAIIWSRAMDYDHHEWNDLVRSLWYQMALAAEDDQTQENGIVIVSNGLGQFSLTKWDVPTIRALLKILNNIAPVRTVGFHHLFNDAKLRTIVPLLLTLSGKSLRARYRMHTGSVQECLFELMCYGIAPEILPIDHEGNTLYDSHLDWIEELRQQGR